MKAKKKPIEQLNASDLGVDTSPRIEQIKVEEPPKRKAGIKVANVAELVQKLKMLILQLVAKLKLKMYLYL